MAASKFTSIIGKVIDHVALDMTARLTFEVSDAVRPMQLFRAAAPVVTDSAVRIALSPRLAPQAASRAIAGWSSSNLPAAVPAPPAAEPDTLLPWSFR